MGLELATEEIYKGLGLCRKSTGEANVACPPPIEGRCLHLEISLDLVRGMLWVLSLRDLHLVGLRGQAFSAMGPAFWNILPSEVSLASSVSAFFAGSPWRPGCVIKLGELRGPVRS